MKIKLGLLNYALNKCKGVVPKKTTVDAWKGVLISKGYLIAANPEITLQVNLVVNPKIADIDPEEMAALMNESLIIPEKAFSMISSLPSGEVEITKDENHRIAIKQGCIKCGYASKNPEDFMVPGSTMDGDAIELPGKKVIEAMKHVIFAAAENEANKLMCGMNIDVKNGEMKFTALDGHVIAMDSIEIDDLEAEFNITLPGEAVNKVISLSDETSKVLKLYDGETIRFKHSEHAAVFEAEGFTIYTRLVSGKYFDTSRMMTDADNYTLFDRTDLLSAVNRAALLAEVEVDGTSAKKKVAMVWNVSKSRMDITMNDSTADYFESIDLYVEPNDPIRIAMNPKLMQKCLKAFTSEGVSISFVNPKAPIYIDADDSNMKVLCLPVNIGDAGKEST